MHSAIFRSLSNHTIILVEKYQIHQQFGSLIPNIPTIMAEKSDKIFKDLAIENRPTITAETSKEIDTDI